MKMELEDQEEDMEVEEASPTNYNNNKQLLLLQNPTTPVHTNRPPHPFHKVATATYYKECLKNHAVALGGHALDGCGEFMPAGPHGSLDALKCAACNCHRNFHRKLDWRAPGEEYLHAAPPQRRMMLALPPCGKTKKKKIRVRTKFTEEQKEKMLGMAEKLEWRIQKNDEAAVLEFCNQIGVNRRVLKVWMHNNKNNNNAFRKAATSLNFDN